MSKKQSPTICTVSFNEVSTLEKELIYRKYKYNLLNLRETVSLMYIFERTANIAYSMMIFT
jgi:hypothetical protein